MRLTELHNEKALRRNFLNITLFCVCKEESFNVIGWLQNVYFLPQWVECGQCLLGGNWSFAFPAACAFEFVPIMLPSLRFQQLIFPRAACWKRPVVSVLGGHTPGRGGKGPFSKFPLKTLLSFNSNFSPSPFSNVPSA